MRSSYFAVALGVAILTACVVDVRAADDASSRSASKTFSLVVMDPLAAPLSCPCVEGYAQRKYEVLGERLEQVLGAPVTVTFADGVTDTAAPQHGIALLTAPAPMPEAMSGMKIFTKNFGKE